MNTSCVGSVKVAVGNALSLTNPAARAAAYAISSARPRRTR
jgi:hypothetical protein